ncbi:PREDICTED: putative uncharacterized protein DDB_G0270496 isoform X2 [Nelumbo nucifera]|uniref:Protein AATF n=1 Tax=Nelumbo nucifera TaxID=4432 RepID=A0A1U8AAW7_NELNU|nr:PREDICTED: putative uncharacterized protein DDB_G0270496 isoform X2 [Nelumbo nucifera]
MAKRFKMGLVSKKVRRVGRNDAGSEDESDPEIETEEEEEAREELEMEDEGEDEEVDEEEEEEEEEDGDDDDKQIASKKDAEIEELEKEYLNLRHQEQDLLKSLKRHKDEDLLKGQAVKNQQVLWDKSLEFRFLLQKAFSSSNKLPQEPMRSSLCDSDEAVKKAYSDLITSSNQVLDSLLELQEALLEKNPSISQGTDGINESSKFTEVSKNLDGEGDKEWSRIYQVHSRIAPFRDSSIDKWQKKTQVTTGAAAFKGNLKAFNQKISEQVADYMRNPNKMIKGMQLHRSAVGVFGADANVDGDPELLDDSEFYQQLLKEFFESVDPNSSETVFYALKRMQTKKRKIVDRRASKSRKIRYHVHEKIVNFMAPEPMNLPPMAPKLFENLFGLKNQKTASVS